MTHGSDKTTRARLREFNPELPKAPPSAISGRSLPVERRRVCNSVISNLSDSCSGNRHEERLCASSLTFRRENTLVLTTSLGYKRSHTVYWESGSSRDDWTPHHCNMPRKPERIIVPSKHGYHPRSRSPTFKRLIQASDKLVSLLDRFSASTVQHESDPNEKDTNCNYSAEDTDTSTVDLIDLYGVSFKPSTAGRDDFDMKLRVEDLTSDIKAKYHVTPRTNGIVLPGDFHVDYQPGNGHATQIHLFLPNILPSPGDIHVDPISPEPEVVSVEVGASPSNSISSFPSLQARSNASSTSKTIKGSIQRRRVNTKRPSVPSKPASKDKQKKGHNSDYREPFIRGESLKESLDDFPTLVSLNA